MVDQDPPYIENENGYFTVINSSAINSSTGSDSYTDFSSVNAISALKDKNQALEKIAKQFESMMIRMMMKSMRSANAGFAEGNFLNSSEAETYQGMLDDQLSLTLSQGKGMGLAEVMVRQLKGRFGESNSEDGKAISGITDYLKNRNDYQGLISGLKGLNNSQDSEVSEVNGELVEFDGSIRQFVAQLYPMAKKAGEMLGVDPKVLIAQSALETGWGMKVSESAEDGSSFNFFNIKADSRWQGNSVTVPTIEVRDGFPVREYADFRSYPSPQQSFDDYVDFVSHSPRYEQALATDDSASYVRGLSEAGYATDPQYAEKIMRIVNSSSLQRAVETAVDDLAAGN